MNRFTVEHELKLAQQRQQQLLQDQKGHLYIKGQRKFQRTDEQRMIQPARRQEQTG